MDLVFSQGGGGGGGGGDFEPDVTAPFVSAATPPASPPRRASQASAASASMWQCVECNHQNHLLLDVCEMCAGVKGEAPIAAPPDNAAAPPANGGVKDSFSDYTYAVPKGTLVPMSLQKHHAVRQQSPPYARPSN